MHERALMRDLVQKIEEVARTGDGESVTRITVRLGALSHFTPEHFREHFADASQGTLAEGAAVDAVVDPDLSGAHASGVVLESVEVERARQAEVS
jgi:hydrogenase nickel incorporation protein HypA/HybF